MMTANRESDRWRSGIGIIGNLNMDLLMGPLPQLPRFGREYFVAERAMRGAGQAFHTAAALSALGEPPYLMGDVGEDAFGAQILADLRAERIDTSDVWVRQGEVTGLTVALLDGQRDRAFVTDLGHLKAMDVDAVLARWPRVSGCRFLLVCGYYCLPGLRPEGGSEILRRARDEGIVTVLDTGWDPGGWVGEGLAEVRALLAWTDIFLPNWEEARAITGLADPNAAASQLAAWGPTTVIVKLGPEGAMGHRDGETVRVPAVPTRVVDTVGAGDTFNAGVLFALAHGWSLAEALRLGTGMSAYAIASHTPRHASMAQVRELLGLTCQ